MTTDNAAGMKSGWSRLPFVILGLLHVCLAAEGCAESEPGSSGPGEGLEPRRSADPNVSSAALSELISRLQDRSAGVRLRAVAGLALMDDVRASPAIIRLAAAEGDPNVLRAAAEALVSLGVARDHRDTSRGLLSKLMMPTRGDWRGRAGAEDVLVFVCQDALLSFHVNWGCLPDGAAETVIDVGGLAGKPVISVLGLLVRQMDPQGNAVVLLTPRLELLSLPEAVDWHQRDRQVRLIRDSHRVSE